MNDTTITTGQSCPHSHGMRGMLGLRCACCPAGCVIMDTAIGRLAGGVSHRIAVPHQGFAVTVVDRLQLTHGNAFQDAVNHISQLGLRCRRRAECGRDGPDSGSYKMRNLRGDRTTASRL